MDFVDYMLINSRYERYGSVWKVHKLDYDYPFAFLRVPLSITNQLPKRDGKLIAYVIDGFDKKVCDLEYKYNDHKHLMNYNFDLPKYWYEHHNIKIGNYLLYQLIGDRLFITVLRNYKLKKILIEVYRLLIAALIIYFGYRIYEW